MKPPRSHHPLLPCDVQRHPQLPVVTLLRAAVVAAVPTLLQTHPAVAAGQVSTTIEAAADDVVRLAHLLRIALDNYRRALRDTPEF